MIRQSHFALLTLGSTDAIDVGQLNPYPIYTSFEQRKWSGFKRRHGVPWTIYLIVTMLIRADLRQTFDSLKMDNHNPKRNSQNILQLVFHSIRYPPELATRYQNTNGKLPFCRLLPEEQYFFLSYVESLRKGIGSLAFCNIFSASKIWARQDISFILGDESGT